VEDSARVVVQPGPNLRVLVGCVVSQDHMHDLAGQHRRLDSVEETNELLVTVPGRALAEDDFIEQVEGGEQDGGAAADVVMGLRNGPVLHHRQPAPGALQRLDLRLLVH
jgi:hypothetical protein